MPAPYETALITGASSGIGRALAAGAIIARGGNAGVDDAHAVRKESRS
jgi:NAD(P)-dependent dehydrogenase (short-subunit alcohol dehydrogenase family)